MMSIEEITLADVSEYNKLTRKSNKKAKEIRSLMLNLLTKAYESEDFIQEKYYSRANDILSLATNKCVTKRLKDTI